MPWRRCRQSGTVAVKQSSASTRENEGHTLACSRTRPLLSTSLMDVIGLRAVSTLSSSSIRYSRRSERIWARQHHSLVEVHTYLGLYRLPDLDER
jgi:hypothetical protein